MLFSGNVTALASYIKGPRLQGCEHVPFWRQSKAPAEATCLLLEHINVPVEQAERGQGQRMAAEHEGTSSQLDGALNPS